MTHQFQKTGDSGLGAGIGRAIIGTKKKCFLKSFPVVQAYPGLEPESPFQPTIDCHGGLDPPPQPIK